MKKPATKSAASKANPKPKAKASEKNKKKDTSKANQPEAVTTPKSKAKVPKAPSPPMKRPSSSRLAKSLWPQSPTPTSQQDCSSIV